MRIFLRAVLLFVLTTTASVLQRSIAKEDLISPTEHAAVLVAQDYVAIHFPKFGTLRNPPIVYDKGGAWQVEYELPSGVMGRTPVVVIEKATLKVLRSFHTQ
jgi:NTF2 fold immunity protein